VSDTRGSDPLEQPSQEAQPLAQIQPQRIAVRMPQRQPYVVYAILGITIFVFLLQLLTESGQFGVRCPFFSETDLPVCYGLKVNELILDGQWWRLIAPILLHASLLHIGFNMYALYVLGPELERHFGHVPFLALYVLSGFAGVVMSFLLTRSPSLGASTSIFGLLAAQGVFVYLNKKLFGRRAQAMLRSIIQIAVINLLIGLTPGIDNWGHVGGLLGGGLFALLAAPVYRVEDDEAEYRLVNRTAPERVWTAIGVVGVVFAVLAYTKFIF
jgi:rhomboid protease GluP